MTVGPLHAQTNTAKHTQKGKAEPFGNLDRFSESEESRKIQLMTTLLESTHRSSSTAWCPCWWR